jgi:hypothetical protein
MLNNEMTIHPTLKYMGLTADRSVWTWIPANWSPLARPEPAPGNFTSAPGEAASPPPNPAIYPAYAWRGVGESVTNLVRTLP